MTALFGGGVDIKLVLWGGPVRRETGDDVFSGLETVWFMEGSTRHEGVGA
jgi:hypothetical protein